MEPNDELTTKEHPANNDALSLEQIELFDISSPCRSICTTNNRGYCVGCMRSRDERFNWLDYSQAERARVMALCSRRRGRVLQKMADKREVQLDLLHESEAPPVIEDLFGADEP